MAPVLARLRALWQPAPMNAPLSDKPDLERSFLAVRKAIGYLGVFLPLSLLAFVAFTPATMETSISAFYYTPMRDVFVGTLAAIAVFLLSYTGYRQAGDEKVPDRRLALAAGASLMVVALVPAGAPKGADAPWIHGTSAELMGGIHLVAAGLFFVFIGGLSWFKFTRGEGTPTAEKQGCGRVYRVCAVIVWACVGVLLVALLAARVVPWVRGLVDATPFVFALEAIGVLAFGWAWLTKGKALWARQVGKMLAPRGP